MITYYPAPITGYRDGLVRSDVKPTLCVETFDDDRPPNPNLYFLIAGRFYNVHPYRADLGAYPVRWSQDNTPAGWPHN